MLNLWIDCTDCDGQLRVEMEAESGEPRTWEHPGTEPAVWITDVRERFGCACEPDIDALVEHNRQRMLEHASEAMRAAEDAYWDRKLHEFLDEGRER